MRECYVGILSSFLISVVFCYEFSAKQSFER